ncbi:hypothetical protein Daus18300_004868 [Diaporthe australafricana]|uniref:Nitroreductase domain-containing protein n=1 Tax=Diaporthe australafricana TaxID=127596 RepID=A0ABR3X602_9PEZI
MSQLSQLLACRYGGNSPPGLDMPMTSVIEMLLQHKSVQKLLPDDLQPGTLEALIAAGQDASTSSMLQTWRAIDIKGPKNKSSVARLAGDQDVIRQAPLFLVFCAELSHVSRICEQHQQSGQGLEKMDPFIMGTVDAALAVQSVALAVESLGLGYCFARAVRNNACISSYQGGLADEKSTWKRPTLGVISGGQVCRNMVIVGLKPGHRCQDNAMVPCDRTDFERLEQPTVCHAGE